MPRFAINVLCQDAEKTCKHVKKNYMGDYEIKSSTENDDFDHIGIKHFLSLEEAQIEALRLKENSAGKILDVSVSTA